MKTKFLRLLLATLILGLIFAPHPTAQAAGSQLRINEIMYDPSGTGDREFIEIYNGSDTIANLSGMSMYGVDFTFFSGTTLNPGQYGVLARNMQALRGSHPSARIFGQYGGKLKGSGEVIRLISNGAIVSQVSYTFGGAWPIEPRNGGPSLSLIRTSANESTAACWLASTTSGGSPGSANGVAASSRGGCDSKAYPVSQVNTPAASTPSSKPSSSTAAVTAPTTAATPSAQAAAAAEQTKKAEEQKILQEAAKKAASPSAVSARIATQSSSRLKIALTLLGLVAILGVVTILWQRHHKLARFKKLTKPKSKPKRKRKK